MNLRIALVAAEPSGDQLGAALMQALKERLPDVTFEGVGGAAMLAEGLSGRIPMEKLSVMGLVEVLVHLPELLRERRHLAGYWVDRPPDLFIGVDAPDFNLGLARRLREAGIPTVQYVAPTVWAWREGRTRTLKRAVDLVLSIYPFEKDFLREHGVNSAYVGHPLADSMPLETDREAARAALGLKDAQEVVALLPGSRRSEVNTLARPFIETARWLAERRPGMGFVTPAATPFLRQAMEVELARLAPELDILVLDRSAELALAAADVVLTASGTATLQALLSKRPMVVGYRMHALSYFIARAFRLVKTPYVAMANIMANEALAPEYLQNACQPANLGPALEAFLDDPQRMAEVRERYAAIHAGLRCDAADSAARAVVDLVARRNGGPERPEDGDRLNTR
ncbi:MAG: lipid-A-disaccharide synthase [Pseudomonadota bacterium]